MNVIDFHTHILPGIDDGSRDLDMTEAMLREELSQEVGLVVATPHFYAHRSSIHHFLEKRQAALEQTEELGKRLGEGAIPPVIAGAEVYYFSGMGRAQMLPQLAIGDTGTILVEMPFEQWTEDVLRDLEDIIRKQKLHIVLAHVERYVEFQRDRTVWDRVMELPLTPQINAGSFIKKKSGLFRTDRKWRFSMEFLDEHPKTILGSDCHNLTERRPNIREGRMKIAEAKGPEALTRIDEAAKEALGL